MNAHIHIRSNPWPLVQNVAGTLLIGAALAACSPYYGSGGGGGYGGSGGGSSPSTGSGQNTGNSQNAGTQSTGEGGANTFYIVNDSSYDVCYTALCDCDVVNCYEENTYAPPGTYYGWTGIPDMCLYVYVEACEGGYWEEFFDVSSDFTWEITD